MRKSIFPVDILLILIGSKLKNISNCYHLYKPNREIFEIPPYQNFFTLHVSLIL